MYIDYPEGPTGNVRTTFWFDKNDLLSLDYQEYASIDYQKYDGKEPRYAVTTYRGGLEDIILFSGTYESCKNVYDGLTSGLRLNATLCSITTNGGVNIETLDWKR